jgi:steroid delta-isomerase-like uncharacterized protein
MHLGYLFDESARLLSQKRRELIKYAGMAALMAGASPLLGGEQRRGFKGSGRMGMSTGEDWIDTFFTGGADEIIHYYADDFVFEDVTLFQTIDNKDDLYRAFVPFNDAGPDSPAGVHKFDIIRYDGGKAGDRKAIIRPQMPEGYSIDEWQEWSVDTKKGSDLDYDEWAVMNWVWRAKHNNDFLGLPAKGKTTHTRGITFHCYKDRKIVREFTYWNFRHVAIQLGVLEPQQKFWLKASQPPA